MPNPDDMDLLNSMPTDEITEMLDKHMKEKLAELYKRQEKLASILKDEPSKSALNRHTAPETGGK
jgi:hypothetical protein